MKFFSATCIASSVRCSDVGLWEAETTLFPQESQSLVPTGSPMPRAVFPSSLDLGLKHDFHQDQASPTW